MLRRCRSGADIRNKQRKQKKTNEAVVLGSHGQPGKDSGKDQELGRKTAVQPSEHEKQGTGGKKHETQVHVSRYGELHNNGNGKKKQRSKKSIRVAQPAPEIQKNEVCREQGENEMDELGYDVVSEIKGDKVKKL